MNTVLAIITIVLFTASMVIMGIAMIALVKAFPEEFAQFKFWNK